MSIIDWIVLCVTLAFIIYLGIKKGQGQTGTDSYILAGKNMPWYTVLIGIMATQASAITFISGPGQAYSDGMRFLQYYFGLPIAMVVISAVFIPYFQKQKTFTAYQFLDQRFDRKTRLFTGFLFLFSRGISTGLSVFAPAIVLSAIFNWNIALCTVLIGGFLIIYTYIGGAQSIASTQKVQFAIILTAMLIAGFMVVKYLPEGVTFSDALYIAGKSDKLNVINTQFDLNDKYNIWSGLIGGFFLALSYFGTDQSQVGRYLTGKDLKQARMGILMNGIVKIPMQFLILLLGTLIFSLFVFIKGPVFYNAKAIEEVRKVAPAELADIEQKHAALSEENRQTAMTMIQARAADDGSEEQSQTASLQHGLAEMKGQKKEIAQLISDHELTVEKDDVNYVFLYFVKNYLPMGVVGLIFAIIFLASWGSISAALNSLASATLIDFHQVLRQQKMSPKEELKYARLYTLLWGLFSIGVAIFIATRMSSLIEAVNVLGSLFYGPILGIFLVAFFFKKIKGSATFWAAVVAEVIVFICYHLEWVSFLWLNVVGAFAVILFSSLLQIVFNQRAREENKA